MLRHCRSQCPDGNSATLEDIAMTLAEALHMRRSLTSALRIHETK
jgi:hypothetical protein